MSFIIPSIFTAVDQTSSVLRHITDNASNAAQRVKDRFDSISKSAQKVAVTAGIIGTATAAPLILAANKAIDFEDRLVDVEKTTGLSGEKLKKYGESILEYSRKTRTGIDDLMTIGVTAGQLGVAQNQLESFTLAADKFNIALGSDFGGAEQAIGAVAKLQGLFGGTRLLEAGDAMNRIGSVINEMTNKGVMAPELTEFITRIGGMPDAFKPSIEATAAIGSVLQKAGMSAEVSASGVSNLMTIAGKNIGGFASQMKISTTAAEKLLNTNPAEFILKFSKSLNGLNAVQMSQKMAKLKINSNEVQKVVGNLASGYDRFSEYLNSSNVAFDKANSLSEEAAKKNATTAARILKLKNSVQTLGITAGNTLIPILNKVFDRLEPISITVLDWTKNNKDLVKNVMIGIGVFSALAFVVMGLASIVATVSILTSAYTLGLSFLSFIIKGAALVMNAFRWSVIAVNLAMYANPVGVIIAAIIILIVIVTIAIYKWDEWGAALLQFLGPIGWIINAIMTFREKWSSIQDAFKNEGIIGGLKRIGQTLLDVILKPLEQIFTMLSNMPLIGDFAKSKLGDIQGWRADMNLNTVTPNPSTSKSYVPAEKVASTQATNGVLSTKNMIELVLKGNTDQLDVTKNTGNIPIKLTSLIPTWGG